MSETNPRVAAAFEGITPIFSVRDLSVSIDYYVRVLGFVLDWEGPGGFASVSRGGCAIFLAEGDQGHPGGWVWIGVGDVDALFKEFNRPDVRVRQAPTNFDWAYEMQVEDPDGNVIRFGSEPKAGLPPGDWIDMRGDHWQKSQDGRWMRIVKGD
jgi:catechol 2,3-dioxygenase-like lactoylglutathione lyase family enzyme